jgi:hypothetical protein
MLFSYAIFFASAYSHLDTGTGFDFVRISANYNDYKDFHRW